MADDTSADFSDARLVPHALESMVRRDISASDLRRVLETPGQVITVRHGRVVLQSIFQDPRSGQSFLLRVFVDIHRTPPEVVTAYKSSKIGKHWSAP